MSFLPGLATLWADLQKIFAFAPVVAAIDPNAAGGIATAVAAITDLQPTVTAVQTAANGGLNHADLVTAVTAAVSASSTQLVAAGVMSGTTEQHIQAIVPVINAAVALSGLAAPAPVPV